MPIGKNAISRITNNGYSSVKTSAPDMENSEVAESKEPKATPKKTTTSAPKKEVPKATPKKATASAKSAPSAQKTKVAPAPKKSTQQKSRTTPKKAPQVAPKAEPKETPQREGEGYINLGGKDLPYYLL